jgi:cytosine/adenosine deaminase-related metal-dependent hydrolase
LPQGVPNGVYPCAAATGAAAGLGLFGTRPAAAHGDEAPEDTGQTGRRYVIRGGAVISIDPQVGDFPQADVLVEGKKILAVGPNLHADDADEIDARGKIVMPGFIDTHHHQFETALRSFLADGVLINDYPPDQWPTPAPGTPPLLTTRDVLRYGTLNGAEALRLENKVGSLTPGKEADILILDAEAINVAPLNNVPGAVVSLMDRTNVETVIVAGKVRKWKGKLLDVDLSNLRRQLENSRDYIFAAAKIPQNLFGSQ